MRAHAAQSVVEHRIPRSARSSVSRHVRKPPSPPPPPPSPPPPPASPPPPPTWRQRPVDNTSGQGERAIVPPEIRGWNWGAFLLNWIWGICNDTYIALLMFVPLVNVVMIFVLGAKGSE